MTRWYAYGIPFIGSHVSSSKLLGDFTSSSSHKLPPRQELEASLTGENMAKFDISPAVKTINKMICPDIFGKAIELTNNWLKRKKLTLSTA